MNYSLPYTFNGDTITVFLYGVPETIDSTHPSFQQIFELLQVGVTTNEQAQQVADLISVKRTIEKAVEGQTFGKVTVGHDAVLYNGVVINTYLTQRMLAILAAGLNIEPWVKFMEKLYQNPSKTAVDELFLWLDKAGMPITDDGNFLAYKKVREDYRSYHTGVTGEVWNTPGSTVEMPRFEVDDNRNKTCSAGLHFCSWHYLPSYHGNSGKVVLVSINPADVVSIPSDYDNSKGRTAKYVVVGEIPEDRVTHAFSGSPIWDGEYAF